MGDNRSRPFEIGNFRYFIVLKRIGAYLVGRATVGAIYAHFIFKKEKLGAGIISAGAAGEGVLRVYYLASTKIIADAGIETIIQSIGIEGHLRVLEYHLLSGLRQARGSIINKLTTGERYAILHQAHIAKSFYDIGALVFVGRVAVEVIIALLEGDVAPNNLVVFYGIFAYAYKLFGTAY